MMRCLAPAILLALSVLTPLSAQEEPTAREVVARGLDAHGGDVFLDPKTLQLTGTATFFDPATGRARSTADDYRMWREFDRGRKEAHGADGKVRIIARQGDQVLFEVGYDGATTWTQDGIMPKEKADAYWASNFGFGIIRSALDDGFTLSFAPDRNVGGHPVSLIRITDPGGQETLFGFDKQSGFIRYMAFDSSRGFHERIYDDFMALPESGWVQARSVTLLYDGIVSNTVTWQQARIGEAIDPAIFTPPQEEDE
ncbi:hypothetical protein [Erythrobacter sp. YT30]|uniref:hypothetical protein n=1 Tax=Erythrobacter sp. YT30 TaxID=1735012 RepID=UPI00076BC9CA|nr:hypothetical protein [Erythrobacter sp. YT30]KWV90769.1 hypothetical protein AUC45_05295 [Erythrobacter sp. YT30]